ncbi:MAG: TonB-dependent receptor, partial [Proteobacteria bacterium]|nr:TonB-dependent receptor [Pseudomonadota bacterium]
MEKRALRSALLGSATALMTVATPAWAAEPPQAGAAAQNPDDIIVTATRREERLQDVPVAVSAVSGQDLAKTGFREATDIQYLAPN